MKSNARRVLLGIALVAAAVVLLIVLQGSEDDASEPNKQPTKPPKPAIPTIVVKGGEPVGGVEQLSFEEGDQIRFKVASDTSDEVHVHTYDVSKEIPAGGSVTLAFPADIEGIFEAELHESGKQIAEIQVNP
jgi:uncharacterized alpha/beta hydrolase family protein